MPVGGRVAGKVGIYSSHYNGKQGYYIVTCTRVEHLLTSIVIDVCMLAATGKGYSGINEEIMWISIGMGIIIAVLITIALCYIAREKCRKRHEGYYAS